MYGILLASAVSALHGQSFGDDLIEVDITRLRSDKGQVLCTLFSSAVDFPRHDAGALMRARSGIKQGRARCEFRGVPSGTYAVAAVHDENSNGRLDRNLPGIPVEGVGASNNARSEFGPPRFADAAFTYAGGHLLVNVEITYT